MAKVYVFEDTLKKEKVAYAFYDGKWREDTIILSAREKARIRRKPKRSKFGYKVYVLDSFVELGGN